MFTTDAFKMTHADLWLSLELKFDTDEGFGLDLYLQTFKTSIFQFCTHSRPTPLIMYSFTTFWSFLNKTPDKMAPKRKCSDKKNLGRKKSQFKKGHERFQVSYTDQIVASSVSNITRPKHREFQDASYVCKSESDAIPVVPTKLRPEKEKDIVYDSGNFEGSEENVIINLHKLTDLVGAFLPHSCLDASPAIDIVNRQGLCITLQVSCHNCSFKSEPVELFTTVKSPKGPPAGTLNVSLLIPALKSKVGIHDLVHTLSCLNIQPPDRRGLQRRFNRLSDLMKNINNKQMLDNQTYVKHILKMSGRDNFVDVEVDSAYNNRPQPGCEAATQSICPLIEQCTTRKLVLNIETANTLCPSSRCQHNTDSCKKNYSSDETMASTESKFVKKHLQKVNTQGILKIKSVTSDASAQVIKAVKDYENESKNPTRHYKCFIHKVRSFQKCFRSIKLTSSLTGRNKEIYMRKLSTNVRARIRIELLRLKKCTHTEQAFVTRAYDAIQNIISCFGNDHRNCRKFSLICTAHLKNYSTSFLPYGNHIELNQCDIIKLKGVIEKYFSKQELSTISRLSTTNQCESLHHKIFTFAPKSTIYTRNFSGLCHSAVHSATLGNGKACINLAKHIGMKYKMSDPFIRQMMKLDKNNEKDALRHKSRKYKFQRYIAKRTKGNRTIRENSLYNCRNKTVTEEHLYANRNEFTS